MDEANDRVRRALALLLRESKAMEPRSIDVVAPESCM